MKSKKKSARKGGKKRGLRGLGLLCPVGAAPKAVGAAGARCFRDGKMVAAVQGPEFPAGYAPRRASAKKKASSKRSVSKTVKITKSVRVSCACAAPKAKIRTAKRKRA